MPGWESMLKFIDWDKEGKYRLFILGAILVVSVLLVVWVNIYYGIDIVYSHFFYIPIIIAGMWYHRKAVWVAALLGMFHIIAGYVLNGVIVSSTLIRAAMFIIIAFVVGVISEKKDKFYDELKISEQKLQQQYSGLEGQHKDLRQKEDELSVLFEAAQLVNSTFNIRQVLESVVDLAQKVVGFDAGGIQLFDRDTREAVYQAIYNYSPDQIANLKHCQPFRDLLENFDKDLIIESVEGRFTCSLLSKIEMAVPMIINSDIYGVWFVENHTGDHFATDRKKILVTLASLTSSAVKNAWLYERTMFVATVDQLTGLYNRQYFDHVLEMEKEKARLIQAPLSLIMVDVNRLKYINDTFGHEMGDHILKESAALLKRSVRKGELVFRYGGDEMVIILADSNYRETSKVVKRIKANIQAWNLANIDKNVFLHLSIGWCTAKKADSLEKLVAAADEEMYRDKAEYYKSHGLTRETKGPR